MMEQSPDYDVGSDLDEAAIMTKLLQDNKSVNVTEAEIVLSRINFNMNIPNQKAVLIEHNSLDSSLGGISSNTAVEKNSGHLSHALEKTFMQDQRIELKEKIESLKELMKQRGDLLKRGANLRKMELLDTYFKLNELKYKEPLFPVVYAYDVSQPEITLCRFCEDSLIKSNEEFIGNEKHSESLNLIENFADDWESSMEHDPIYEVYFNFTKLILAGVIHAAEGYGDIADKWAVRNETDIQRALLCNARKILAERFMCRVMDDASEFDTFEDAACKFGKKRFNEMKRERKFIQFQYWIVLYCAIRSGLKIPAYQISSHISSISNDLELHPIVVEYFESSPLEKISNANESLLMFRIRSMDRVFDPYEKLCYMILARRFEHDIDESIISIFECPEDYLWYQMCCVREGEDVRANSNDITYEDLQAKTFKLIYSQNASGEECIRFLLLTGQFESAIEMGCRNSTSYGAAIHCALALYSQRLLSVTKNMKRPLLAVEDHGVAHKKSLNLAMIVYEYAKTVCSKDSTMALHYLYAIRDLPNISAKEIMMLDRMKEMAEAGLLESLKAKLGEDEMEEDELFSKLVHDLLLDVQSMCVCHEILGNVTNVGEMEGAIHSFPCRKGSLVKLIADMMAEKGEYTNAMTLYQLEKTLYPYVIKVAVEALSQNVTSNVKFCKEVNTFLDGFFFRNKEMQCEEYREKLIMKRLEVWRALVTVHDLKKISNLSEEKNCYYSILELRKHKIIPIMEKDIDALLDHHVNLKCSMIKRTMIQALGHVKEFVASVLHFLQHFSTDAFDENILIPTKLKTWQILDTNIRFFESHYEDAYISHYVELGTGDCATAPDEIRDHSFLMEFEQNSSNVFEEDE